MSDFLKVAAGLIVSAGLYVFYEKWRMRYGAERARYTATWRTPPTDGRRRSPIRSVIVALLVGAIVFFGIRQVQRIIDARHPAAEEHRPELLEIAAARLNCEKEALTVHREEDPRRARVEGCGKVVTFRWAARLVRRQVYSAQQWYEIDPNCRVDYMGCSMPCE